MSTATETKQTTTPPGGGFLLESPTLESVFTPEDFSEEHRQIHATTDRFLSEEVIPQIPEIEKLAPALSRGLLEKAAELGLLGILVPEQYGGLELDLTSQVIVAERMGRYASFSTTYGAHSGIGTLPLVFFGNDEQKQRYLPRLVNAELMAAYCLSESHAGSDALAARTRADLSPDGKHYILNGEKMWISNGGWADLYTIFAKVGGEKFTAFLVERTMPGVRPGAEEHKMGLKGSSTTAVVLDNVSVPVENVLGEIGRGHIIAFNILNIGRLKLGASCVGGGQDVLAASIGYAKDRKAFGHPIAGFGLIQHKLAEMAIRIFATESIVYRTAGLITGRLERFSWDAPNAAQTALKAIEEYAAECSIVKVFGTEAIDYIVDEGVQIHGGYGFHQDYAVARAYREARVNRIFAGTNQINRLLTTGMLLKRAAKGELPLMAAVQRVAQELATGQLTATPVEGPFAAEHEIIARMKKIALWSAGVAYQRFGDKLEHEQEVAAAICDIISAVYAAESATVRAENLAAAGRSQQAAEMTRVFVRDQMNLTASCASTVLSASLEGDSLGQQSKLLSKLSYSAPVNSVALRRSIAKRLLEAGKYVV
jgi:alkylation response protein AidB-like acyl-CoA dehydrogenase